MLFKRPGFIKRSIWRGFSKEHRKFLGVAIRKHQKTGHPDLRAFTLALKDLLDSGDKSDFLKKIFE